MPDVNTTIEAAIAAAAALNGGAQAAAGSQVASAPGAPGSTNIATYSAPGPMMTLEDSIAGMSVDAYLKLKYQGIYVKNDPTPFFEIEVQIRGTEIAPHKAVRFGMPANYKRTYDGRNEFRTGQPWAEVVFQCKQLDPKCTGDYDAYDLPFHLVGDMKASVGPNAGQVLVAAGKIVGYSTAIMAAKEAKAFVKNVIMPLGKATLLQGKIRLKPMKNDKGEFGVLEFGTIADWKAVNELAQAA